MQWKEITYSACGGRGSRPVPAASTAPAPGSASLVPGVPAGWKRGPTALSASRANWSPSVADAGCGRSLHLPGALPCAIAVTDFEHTSLNSCRKVLVVSRPLSAYSCACKRRTCEHVRRRDDGCRGRP